MTAYSGLRGGDYWVLMDISEGSYGGRHGKDGLDAVDTLYANTRNNPIEDIESHYPLRVTRYELQRTRAVPGAGAEVSARFVRSSFWRTARLVAGRRRLGLRAAGPLRRRRRNDGRVATEPLGPGREELPSKFPYRAAQRRPPPADRALRRRLWPAERTRSGGYR